MVEGVSEHWRRKEMESSRWGISSVGLEHGIGGWRSKGWRRVVARKRGTVIVPPFTPFSPLLLTPTLVYSRSRMHARTHACTHVRETWEGSSSAPTSADCDYDTRASLRLTMRAKYLRVCVCMCDFITVVETYVSGQQFLTEIPMAESPR